MAIRSRECGLPAELRAAAEGRVPGQDAEQAPLAALPRLFSLDGWAQGEEGVDGRYVTNTFVGPFSAVSKQTSVIRSLFFSI